MTKRILAVLVVLLLAGTVGLVAGCGGNLPNDAVAKVGSIVITQEGVRPEDRRFRGPVRRSDPRQDERSRRLQAVPAGRPGVHDHLRTGQPEGAKSLKITVTDDEVQKEIDSVLADSFGGDQAKFDDALKQQGITLDQLKRATKNPCCCRRSTTKSPRTSPPSRTARSRPTTTRTRPTTSSPRPARRGTSCSPPIAGRVDATTSTTSTSSTTSTTAGLDRLVGFVEHHDASTDRVVLDHDHRRADPGRLGLRARSGQAGAGRTSSAAPTGPSKRKMYSDDPGSKATGGDLGTISKGEMVKEFEDAVFSLKKDEISEPVKTAYGYHIIQVTGITAAKQYTLDEVKPDQQQQFGNGQGADQDHALGRRRARPGADGSKRRRRPSAWSTATTWLPTTTTTTGGGSRPRPPAAPSTRHDRRAPSTTTTAGATITTAAPDDHDGRAVTHDGSARPRRARGAGAASPRPRPAEPVTKGPGVETPGPFLARP